jgi:hypothetical protein
MEKGIGRGMLNIGLGEDFLIGQLAHLVAEIVESKGRLFLIGRSQMERRENYWMSRLCLNLGGRQEFLWLKGSPLRIQIS